jgi:hypothetical protein
MKKLKAVAKNPEHYKALIKAQFVITYVDSSIVDPLGRIDSLIHSFECEGLIVQPLPKQFRLVMQLIAIPVRGKKLPVPLLTSPDIMMGGKLFQRPYTKAEIKKMRADEAKREKELQKSSDYDDE